MTLDDDLAGQSPFPPGTTVVLLRDQPLGERLIKAGVQGRVLEDTNPEAVRVTTLRGDELVVPRDALVLQRGGPTPAQPALPTRAAWERYRDQIVLVTQVGSRAWNLTTPDSDEDHRGCYLAPFEATASLCPPPPQIEDPAADGTYWELRKLIELGLRADPNVIEALYGPVVRATAVGERILATRQAFLSRRVLGTFGRYALNQLERLQNRGRRNRLMERAAELWRAEPQLSDTALIERLARDLSEETGQNSRKARRAARDVLKDLASSLCDRGQIADRDPATVRAFLAATDPNDPGWLDARADRPKNAMHLLRILHSGLSLLEGSGPLIAVPEGALREELLRIKRGEVALADVVTRAREVARTMEEAAEASPLPAEPDREAAEALLRSGRRAAHPWRQTPAAWPAAPVAREPTRAPSPLPDELLLRFLRERPERCFLAAVSGSHAYGFPSPDSDVDLKAIHLAPTAAVLGLESVRETADFLGVVEGVEIDYTSHELGKACRMLLKGDGNLLERVLGPYPVLEHPRAAELRRLAADGVHQGYARHYAGFSKSLFKEYERGKAEGTPRVKPLLYVFRTALTGAHLLRTGECDPDLPRNLTRFPALSAVAELIELKRSGDEKQPLPDDAAYLPLVERAWALLAEAEAASSLPARPDPAPLSAWLSAVRLSDG
jgi:predicted nucleotidyltransferase